jgi:hypothetical protein
VIKNIAGQSAPLLYSLVAYDRDNKSYLPIAEFLTTCHSQNEISLYLKEIKFNFEKYISISQKRFKFTSPQIYVTDQSWASISAILEIFGNTNVPKYLATAFEIIFKNKCIEEAEACIIILDKIHLLKNFIKHSKKISHPHKENEIRVKKCLAFCFTLLQNTEYIKEFEYILRNIFMIFNIKRQTKQFLDSLYIIQNAISNRGLNKFDIPYEQTQEEKKKEDSKKEMKKPIFKVFTKNQFRSLKKESPFTKYYNKKIHSWKESASSEINDVSVMENIFYNPCLFKQISEYLYLTPFWTKILIRNIKPNFELSYNGSDVLNNNPVENYFDIFKNNLLAGITQSPSEICGRTYCRLEAKYNLFYYNRKNEISPNLIEMCPYKDKPKKNESKVGEHDEPIESWNKGIIRKNPGFYENHLQLDDLLKKNEVEILKNRDFIQVFESDQRNQTAVHSGCTPFSK